MIDILEKTKICTKCNTKYSATLEYFSPDKRNRDSLQSWCRKCIEKHHKHYNQTEKGMKWREQYDYQYHRNHREKRLGQHKQWYQKHRERELKKSKKYRNTIEGHLRHVYSGITYRCNNPRCATYSYYGGRGIKVKFTSDEFVDYVMNELKIDPIGLTVDRIDNDGNYESGNIRFVTQAENNKNKF